MKVCPKCNRENSDQAKFCAGCGNDLTNLSSSSKGEKKNNILKKPLTWLIILVGAGVFLLSQLGIIGPDTTTYLIVSKGEVVFYKPGGDVDIDIDTDGRRWEISHKPDWCDIDEDDMSFSIGCDKNYGSENRTGWITVVSGDYNVQIEISQYGYATYLNLSDTQISIDRWGDSFDIEVETDGDDWSVEYPKFCEVETSSDDFEISFPKNTSYSRSGYLTVLVDNQRRTISYYQKGKCRYCNGKGEIACAWCSGLGKVMGNVDWYGNIQYVSCSSCGGDGAIECASCNGSGWE